jgi:hypothetical protein
MKTTRYFDRDARRKHPEVKREWIERVLAHPSRREVQPDGRIHLWGRIREFGNQALRVVVLPDGETVHNALFVRGFRG